MTMVPPSPTGLPGARDWRQPGSHDHRYGEITSRDALQASLDDLGETRKEKCKVTWAAP